MKRYCNSTAILLLPFFIGGALNADAQLSRSFINVLPDSARPVPLNKKPLTLSEELNILNAELLNQHKEFQKEVDSIVNNVAVEIPHLTVSEQIIDASSFLASYYSTWGKPEKALSYFDIM